MFGKITHSLSGNSIIFDCILFGTHFLSGKWGPLLVSFFSVSEEFWTTLFALTMTGGETGEREREKEQWQAWANKLSMIKAAEWKGTLCTVIGGGQEGTVVKHIMSTQSFSDTVLHRMEKAGEVGYISLIITTIQVATNTFIWYSICRKSGCDQCNCIIIKH